MIERKLDRHIHSALVLIIERQISRRTNLHSKAADMEVLKPIRCKAAVSRAPGAPLQMEEVVVAPPKAHEVRIKVICASLCHSDISFWQNQGIPGFFPVVLGHEAVGVVESVGEGVTEVAAGDTVVPVCIAQCGNCRDCVSERSNMCSVLPVRPVGMPRDGTTRFTDAAGAAVNTFFSVSSFAEYTVVDIAHLVRVDPAAAPPPEIACLLSCGVTTGIGAAWRAAAVEKGSTVAVIGLGTVGLAVAEGARVRGAARIIGVDLNPHKFELGKRFGVTEFINPKEIGERSISEVIREMTDGGGVDFSFECVGSAALVSQAIQSTRTGCGTTVILGLDMQDVPITMSSHEMIRGKTITGRALGGIKPKFDIPVLIRQYMDKELRLDGFITHQIGFSEVNKAFDLMLQGKSLRCTIWMGK